MYASEVDDKKLTFFVSGKLWGRSLVMEDKETGSEWSHILGEAKAGPMKGKSLTIIPSMMTNWAAWKQQHPETTITMIDRTASEFQSEMLRNGFEFGIGLVRGKHARLWRFDQLAMQPLVNDQISGLPVVVHYDLESRTPVVWQRKLADRVLTFRWSDQRQATDDQTQSTWDLHRGLATQGALAGTQLKPTTAIVTFRRAWLRFHPESTQWELGDAPNAAAPAER